MGRAAKLASLLALGISITAKASLAAASLDDTVHLSADEAEAELEPLRLRLRGNVIVTCGAYRLTSDELGLQRLDDGLVVEGPASIDLCACESAPLALGFDRARIDEDGDLRLTWPRLEVGGTTAFALPWFWLRPPSKPGLLPPRIAWRGRDGLLLGGGVHLPWNEGASFLALGAAAYTRGGFEATARLRTPTSTTSFRWDRRGEDLVAVEAAGTAALAPTADITWSVDALRGPRALPGTADVHAISRPYDRAEVMSASWLGPLLVGTGFRAYGARNAFASGHAIGPRISLASGSALGWLGGWDAQLLGEVLAIEDTLFASQAAHALHADIGVDLATQAGPVVFSQRGRASSMVVSAGRSSSVDARALAGLRASLPLVRSYALGSDELVHLVEPHADLSARFVHTAGAFFENDGTPLGRAGTLLAATGLRTAAQSHGTTTSLDVGVGALLPSLEPVVRPKLAHRTRLLAFALEGAAQNDGDHWGRALLGRVRMGPPEAGHLELHVAHRQGLDPTLARLLASETSRPFGFLAWPGTSGGADAAMPLGRAFLVRAGADLDFDGATVLAARGSAEWRHPCGCIVVGLHGQSRLGREGVDVMASVELGR